MEYWIGSFLHCTKDPVGIVWRTGPVAYVTFYQCCSSSDCYIIATRTLERYLEEVLK